MSSVVLSQPEILSRIKKFQERDLVRHTTRWYLASTGVMVQVGSYTPPEDMFLVGWLLQHQALQPGAYSILNASVSDMTTASLYAQTDTDGGPYLEATCLTSPGKPGVEIYKSPDPATGYYLEKGKTIYIMAGQSIPVANLYNFGLCKLWFLRTYR